MTDLVSDESSRILIIAPQPFYQDRGTPIAVLHAARALVRAGFKVDIVAFCGGEDPDCAGIRVCGAKSRWSSPDMPIGLSWRKVAQHYALYRLAKKMLARYQYAAIHAVEESIITAWVLTLNSKIPVVYDMHSWLSDELSKMPVLKCWPLGPLIRAVERRAAGGVRAVFCSAGLRSAALGVANTADVTEWLFPIQQRPLDSPRKSAIRQRYGISPDSKLIVYSGNLAPFQNIDLLVEAISLVLADDPSIEAAIVGATGADEVCIRIQLTSKILSRVHVIERQPRSKALELMASADVAVSLRVRGLNVPLKLFDYIGAGVPVVATDIPAHRVILGKDAVYCQSSAADLGDAIGRLLDDRNRCDEIKDRYALISTNTLSEDKFSATVANVYRRVCDTDLLTQEDAEPWTGPQSLL